MKFEILIDSSFSDFVSDGALSPIDNKKVLSLVNDFQDGHWRYDKFQKYIWDNISETALSLQERNSLIDDGPFSTVVESAKRLRLTDKESEDKGKGSELAEILLYGIMKDKFNALSVVPKIFYKQNDNDPVKGADSVHIVIEDGNDFSIWFGEAKFFNSIENVRLGNIIDSVEASLITEKLEKENTIITNVSDIDDLQIDDQLRLKIKSFLRSGQSMDNIKPKLNIPILLLHECEITKAETMFTAAYKSSIIEHHKERAIEYFTRQIKQLYNTVHLYSEIKFHIILFPVPVKSKIVDKFISNVELLKSNARV